MKRNRNGANGKRHATQQSLNGAVKATQVLFLQHVIASLKPGGRCGMVLDEGVLFRTTEGGAGARIVPLYLPK